MRIIAFLLAFLPALMCSVSAVAADRSLDLSVLSPQLQEEIKKQFPAFKTNAFTKADLDALIKYLVQKEQYETVQFQAAELDGKEMYSLNVGRTRRISALKIVGSDEISVSEIRQELGVAEKSVFDQQALIEGGDRIRRYYRDRGFRNTVIDLEFARLSATEVEVTVKVKEGPQTRVTEIELKASNPLFKTTFERSLRKELEDEPLTDNLISGIRKQARELFSSKRFLKAELMGPEVAFNSDESKAKLIFTVPNSDQYFLNFTGLDQKGRSSVEDALELDQFFSSNPNIGPELATRVKNYYLSLGFARVEVSGHESDLPRPFEKRVTIEINEGPRVKIKDIRFIGHYSLPEEYYVEFLKDYSTELIQDGYYNREGVETGLKNLIIDRQNQGFLRAKVLSSKTAATGNKKQELNLTVNLDEGPLTQLESVKFEGNGSFSEAQLLNVAGLVPHEPLKLNQLEEAIGKLKSFYRNSGYLEMNLKNEREDLVQYNADSTLASVVFKIQEGPKIVVASIFLEGNTLTQDYVILKELDFKPGDTLTPQLIEESIRRLQRLGHFNTVDIRTLEEKTQISQRTVIVRVTDRDPGLFNIGAGVNSELGLSLRGYTGIAYRNILGTGRGVSLRLEGNYNVTDIKYLERRIQVEYVEPYLLDTRLRGRVTYTQAIFVSDFDLKKATELKQISYTVEQDITSHISFSYDLWNSAQLRKYPIEQRTTCVEGDPDPAKACIPSEELVIVTTGPTVDFDFRDHPFNPTSGTFTRLNAEYSDPALGSSETINYWRGFANFTHYKSIFKPTWVWANSVRGGYLRNLSADGGVPYEEKGLTLGGQSTIRGFLPDEAFPNRRDLGKADNDLSEFLLTNSASMFLFKSELRFPVWGPVGGAVFYDGGAVFVQNVGFEDPYRDAVGIGLRYGTPFGAVSLDLGYKLDLREDRREAQWPVYFSIGTF